MTDLTATPPALPSESERRSALAKALRKYRGDGYDIALSGDGLTATLSRKRRIGIFWNVVLSIVTGGLWLIVVAIRALNRKTDSLVLYVDDRGKVVRS